MMIPLVKKNYRAIGGHLLFWLFFILYNLIDAGWTDNYSWIFSIPQSLITDLVVIIPMVYINLYMLMPVLYNKRKYVIYICCFIFLLFAGGLGKRFFAFSLWLPLEHLNNPANWDPGDFWILARIVKNIAKIFPVIAATMVLKLVSNAYQQEIRLRTIEREKFDAEIGFLKAQINPHFFFNTLNSLYFLTLENSPKAPTLVMHLSQLMRYMLYDTSTSQVLLTDELAHLKNYIGIEQMRFGDQLELSFQYSGQIDGQWIAPLLLLPFVENAFKHGIKNNGGWVTIDLKVSEKRLYLKVENSFAGTFTQRMGLKNVKRRLALIYPLHHQLSIKQDNNIYQVDLKIDL
ncbi:MAG: sensor histidine kinase [Mucilaginibacter sp.]|nr:sensor histidine kinase [Mucilaginibacter sp.]